MSAIDIAYLALVLAAFASFGVVLAIYSRH
jgi:hypothetical protein